MVKFRKVAIRSIPAVVGLVILLIIGGILSGSVYYRSNLMRYGHPICNIDRHQFESEECEACGRSIKSVGVFYSMAVALENPFSEDHELRFTDFYETYEDFESDWNTCVVYGIVGVVLIILEVCWYVFLFFVAGKNKKARLRRAKT